MTVNKAVAQTLLTISTVEQDLDTLSQRVDVLGFTNERVPLFCGEEEEEEKVSVVPKKPDLSDSVQLFIFFPPSHQRSVNNLLSIDLGNESDLLMGLLLTSELLSCKRPAV